MKPGTLQYINKKLGKYHIIKHTFDLTEKPTFYIYDMEHDIPRNEIPINTDHIELYSKFYNKVFGILQLTLDLDNV
jgi:hypothetical protein